MHRLSVLDQFENERSIKLVRDIELSRVCTIGVGGRAQALVSPRSQAALVNVIRALVRSDIPYRVIGAGSNVFFDDAGADGVVVNTSSVSGISADGGMLKVQCGTPIPLLCSFAARSGLDGLYGLCGIPGTVGGALMTAAGAFGCNIYDGLCACTVYFPSVDRVERLKLSSADYSYRSSPLKHLGGIVLDAELSLPKADGAAILRKTEECEQKRRATQPRGEKSAGSYFKRPENAPPAAFLIDRALLKGAAVGGAVVSEKHAGFIVNRGGATSSDVLRLAEKIKATVMQRFGVALTEEVTYISAF